METNFSKSHEEMQLERINTVAEPKGWWHKEVEELKQQLAAEEEKKHMAMDLCKGYLDELAAALAACKSKDEALEKACTRIEEYGFEIGEHWNTGRKALAIQPDDSALKAWLGEPVMYLDKDGCTILPEDMEGNPRAHWQSLYAPKGMK